MHLFAILLKGSYAMEVKIVRAADKDAAKKMSAQYVGDLFTSAVVTHLDSEGPQGECFSAHYVE